MSNSIIRVYFVYAHRDYLVRQCVIDKFFKGDRRIYIFLSLGGIVSRKMVDFIFNQM